MPAWLHNLTIAPAFPDPEKTHHAWITNQLILFTLPVILVVGLVFVFTSPLPWVTAAPISLFVFASLLILRLLHAGWVRLAGVLFTAAIWVSITIAGAAIHRQLGSPIAETYLLVIAVAGLLLGGRYAYAYAGLSFLLVFGLYLLDLSGRLPAALIPLTPLRALMLHAANFLMAALLLNVISRTMHGALSRSFQHELELTQKNRELEDIRASLEERIEQRTGEISKQKQFFQALVENSPVAVVVLDSSHLVISCNPAFEKLFGYSQSEVIGRELDSLITDSTCQEEANRYTRQALSGQPIHGIGQRRRKDGHLVDVEIFGLLVSAQDQPVGILALYHDITELRRAEAKYQSLFENVIDGVYQSTPDGRILTANPALVRMLGYSSMEELLTVNISRDLYVEPGERDLWLRKLDQAGEERNIELLLKRKDGSLITVLENSRTVQDDHGRVLYYEGTLTDITERKQAEDALRAAKEYAEQLYRIVPSAIFTVDSQGTITSFNAKAAEITGYSPDEIIGKPCTTFAIDPCAETCGLFAAYVQKPLFNRECKIRNKSGELRTVLKNAEYLHDARGQVYGGIESFTDITERKQAEEVLQFLASHDPLTVLPNRSSFFDRLRRALHQAQKQPGRVAVMFLDLDHFKEVNDVFGHAQGDLLLQEVADRLKEHLRKSDTVARIGGDEFAFLFEHVDQEEDAARIAEKILATLAEPFYVEGKAIHITASIGISLSPQNGEDADSLIRNADMAMFQVKKMGKNSYQFFTHETGRAVERPEEPRTDKL